MSSDLTLISRKYSIHSITTDRQFSEPLVADRIVTPNSGDTGPYIERHRYIYRWENQYLSTTPPYVSILRCQQMNANGSLKYRRTFTLYKGTQTPLPSDIRLYRNTERKIVAIFPAGDQIQPPDLSDSQIPYATIVILREYLRPPPPPSPTLHVFPQLTPEQLEVSEIPLAEWDFLSHQPIDIQVPQLNQSVW